MDFVRGTLYKRISDGLFDIGAVKFNTFRLKHHGTNPGVPLSPFYIDLRLLRSHQCLMDLVVAVYMRLCVKLKFDRIADVPTASTPIVSILANRLRVPMISPRKSKNYGLKGSIDGAFGKGETVLVCDDLITTASSKFEAIKILEENGLEVKQVLVLIDRGQSGKRELEKKGYELINVFEFRDLLWYYYLCGKRINQQIFNETMEYLSKNK